MKRRSRRRRRRKFSWTSLLECRHTYSSKTFPSSLSRSSSASSSAFQYIHYNYNQKSHQLNQTPHQQSCNSSPSPSSRLRKPLPSPHIPIPPDSTNKKYLTPPSHSALAISLPQWNHPSNSPSRLSSSHKSPSGKDFSSSSPSSEACDGDENGCYAHQCSCDLIDPSSDYAPQQDDHLGEEACNYFAESYPNLVRTQNLTYQRSLRGIFFADIFFVYSTGMSEKDAWILTTEEFRPRE